MALLSKIKVKNISFATQKVNVTNLFWGSGGFAIHAARESLSFWPAR
jgi:hypothetical protein